MNIKDCNITNKMRWLFANFVDCFKFSTKKANCCGLGGKIVLKEPIL
jgi:hypothetical protein